MAENGRVRTGGADPTSKTDAGDKAGGTLAAKPDGAAVAVDPAAVEGSGLKPEAQMEAKVESKVEAKSDAKDEAKPDAAAASSETPAAEGDDGAAPAANAADMMDGVPGMGGPGARRGTGAGAPPPPKYEPTAWGRYAKVLLSSSEFLFIN